MPPVLLVALGGVVGALARAGVGEVLPHEAGSWAWSTVLVNAAGAFVLCLLLPLVRTPATRLALATGLLGSFTTFSGFALDAVLLADEGRPALAGAYVLVSLVTLLVAGLLGRLAARAVLR